MFKNTFLVFCCLLAGVVLGVATEPPSERNPSDLREQLRSHPRFQMPVEVDFTTFIGAEFCRDSKRLDNQKWLERYQATDRSSWRGDWPDQPKLLPTQVLYHDAGENFYAHWYRGTLSDWYADFYPAYAGLLFLLEDLLRKSGREADRDEMIASYNAVWEVICGISEADLPEPPVGNWPEPMGDLLEVLAAGAEEAANQVAFQRLRDWTQRTKASPDTIALPLAHFVIGLGLLREDPESAANHFRAVRDSVDAGAPDWDFLVAQSFAWNGLASLRKGDFRLAHLFYSRANFNGFSDLPSLIHVLQAILSSDDNNLQEIAYFPDLAWRMLLFTLREAPRYGRVRMTEEKQRFVELMFETIPVNTQLGPIMAMLADRRGEAERRQSWLEISADYDPLAWYLHYRDALQAGEIEEAFAWQDQILELWSADNWVEWRNHFLWPHFRVGGEFLHRSLALDRAWMLALRGEFVESVPWFLVAEPPTAFAIGERLLTTAEMREVLDRLQKDKTALWQTFEVNSFDDWPMVLSARLAREGNWAEAEEVLPAGEEVAALDKILSHLEALESMSGEPAQQAEKLFAAARAIRDNGDFSSTKHVHGIIHDDGRFYSGVRMYRMRRMRGQSFVDEVPFRLPVTQIIDRLAATADTNHLHGRTCRYAAAELAWQAAELLPDNDQRAAEILWHGGVWLMYIDPEAANRFYRALVLQHSETEIGRAAATLRWFPENSF